MWESFCAPPQYSSTPTRNKLPTETPKSIGGNALASIACLEKVLGADERSKQLEYALFCELRERVAAQVGRLQVLAHLVAQIDCVASLAEVAVDRRYTRPTVDGSVDLDLTAARHEVWQAVQHHGSTLAHPAFAELPPTSLGLRFAPGRPAVTGGTAYWCLALNR